ncbi:hypothetical protein CLU79DRAFT_780211 [Phycomyces nitens]|nr:hypothetical protein CLU79DRAFT_780211 [Phycomyces nitens]
MTKPEMTTTTRPPKKESDKIFVCRGFSPCNMGFSRSEHLNRHRRKHTGEKPYACTYHGCLRSFSRFDNMKQHLNTHNENKSRSRRFCTTDNVKMNQKKLNLTDKNENCHHTRNYSDIPSSADHSPRETTTQTLSPAICPKQKSMGLDHKGLKKSNGSRIDASADMKRFGHTPRVRQLSEPSNPMTFLQTSTRTLPPLRPRNSIQLACPDKHLFYCGISKEINGNSRPDHDPVSATNCTLRRLLPIASRSQEYISEKHQEIFHDMNDPESVSHKRLPSFPLMESVHEPSYCDTSNERGHDFVQEPRRRLSIKDLCEQGLGSNVNASSVDLVGSRKKSVLSTDDYEAALALERFHRGS